MKTKYLMLVLSLGLLLLPGATCKPSGPPPTAEARVFDNYVLVYEAAREAYKSAQKLDLQGKLKPGRMVKIDESWRGFHAAYKVAFAAANRNGNAVAPADLLALRDAFLKLITESSL